MTGTTSGAAKSATSVGRHSSIVPSSTQACKAGAVTMPTAPGSTSRRSQRGGASAIETANEEGDGGHCRAPQVHRAQVTALPLNIFLASYHFIMIVQVTWVVDIM